MNGIIERDKNNFHWIYWVAWAALLALASATVAQGADARGIRSVQRRGEYREDRDTSREIDFMQRMMDIEAASIRLAQVGERKSSHHDLRDLLDQIANSGQNRIDQFGDWLNKWYGVRYTPRIDSKYADRASVLSQSGMRSDEFEIRMLKSMVENQQEEVLLIDRYQPYIVHEALRDMLRPTRDNRVERTQKFQTWLKSWYDISYTSQFDLSNRPSPETIAPYRYRR